MSDSICERCARSVACLCERSPRSGLSANTISLIERGASSPSVSTLHRLAKALGVPITAFFADPGDDVKIILTRAGERARSGSASVVLESLGSGLIEQACEPFVVVLKPRANSGDQVMVHGGHELVFCLTGELDYEISGELYRLMPGDALLFHATLPHRWGNPNDEAAEFVLIMQATEEVHESVNQHLRP